MEYTKPTLTELGDARVVIQGSKNSSLDGGSSPGPGPDLEFND